MEVFRTTPVFVQPSIRKLRGCWFHAVELPPLYVPASNLHYDSSHKEREFLEIGRPKDTFFGRRPIRERRAQLCDHLIHHTPTRNHRSEYNSCDRMSRFLGAREEKQSRTRHAIFHDGGVPTGAIKIDPIIYCQKL
jgi:hypothetical protein